MTHGLIEARAALSALCHLVIAAGGLTALAVIAASLCRALPTISALRALSKEF